MAFWSKCCYFDWHCSVAPPTGHSNTTHNVLRNGGTRKCVEMLWNNTDCSVPHLSTRQSRVVWSRRRCFVWSQQTLVRKIAPLHPRERASVPYLCFYTLRGLSVRSLGFLEVQSCQRLLGQLMFPLGEEEEEKKRPNILKGSGYSRECFGFLWTAPAASCLFYIYFKYCEVQTDL